MNMHAHIDPTATRSNYVTGGWLVYRTEGAFPRDYLGMWDEPEGAELFADRMADEHPDESFTVYRWTYLLDR